MHSICVVGLGYVGLPLAIEFAKKYSVVGFDIDDKRISELLVHHDRTLEVSKDVLMKTSLRYASKTQDIGKTNIYIITVPTPIDEYKKPDLGPLLAACNTVGSVLKQRDLVIFESTVYPGCTEEDCVPVLERRSGLRFNKDFFCGYSPERMNPGDKERTVKDIIKITSGSTPEVADKVDELYGSIVQAGTFKASSIKVAEAAKVIENSQRDINIAFVNELALIFNKMNIDTSEVLKAAGTKWNFVKFYPGLVGGHCIGVDPYYLTHKAEGLGYHPEVILAGRRINDSMGTFVANQVVKLMIKKNHQIKGSNVLVLGLTFKENCPDIRNTRVIDIVRELQEFGCNVQIFDPYVSDRDLLQEYNLHSSSASCLEQLKNFAAVVLAVPHKFFLDLKVNELSAANVVFYDVKGLFPKNLSDGRL